MDVLRTNEQYEVKQSWEPPLRTAEGIFLTQEWNTWLAKHMFKGLEISVSGSGTDLKNPGQRIDSLYGSSTRRHLRTVPAKL